MPQPLTRMRVRKLMFGPLQRLSDRTPREELMMATIALQAGTRVEDSQFQARRSQAGTVSSSLRPEMWSGQITHAHLVAWDDCKVPVFVVGSTIRKLAKR